MKILGKYMIRIFAVSMLFALLSGCGGSAPEVQTATQTKAEKKSVDNQEDMSDIESLLGIESTEAKKKTKPQEGDDDVLTLLGAQDKPKEVKAGTSGAKKSASDKNLAKGAAAGATTAAIVTKKKKTAAPEVDKDAEIQRLKNELKDKEAKIKRLESTPPPASTTVAVSADHLSKEEYADLYQQGLDLFNSRQYKEAITVFKRLIASNDNYDLSDNAQYWIGESNYMLGNYNAAILDFEKVFTYPNSNKNDYAQFKLGKCYLMLGDKQRAREEFQRFLDQYPKSPLRAKAEKELAKL